VDYCIQKETACQYTNCPDGQICVIGKCYPFIPGTQGVLNLSGNISLTDGIKSAGANELALDSVRVVLFNSDGTSLAGETYSDEEGNYLFTRLTPGDYRIFVVYPPFAIETNGEISLRSDSPETRLDLVLEQDIFKWTIDYSTHLVALAGGGNLKIYPNPSTGIIYVSGDMSDGNMRIAVSDITGRKVFEEELESPQSMIQSGVQIPVQSSGLYIVSVFINNQILKRELIKFEMR
jgi:hypothetical protein